MAKNAYVLEHAKHNEEVCRALLGLTGKNFYDWVVTTAYYSAIYYVCYELFPTHYDFKGRSLYCHSYEDYYSKLKDKGNKHSERVDLVSEMIPEVADDFATLNDMCFTARYYNYKTTKEEANLALECLENIKSICDKI